MLNVCTTRFKYLFYDGLRYGKLGELASRRTMKNNDTIHDAGRPYKGSMRQGM